MVPFDLGRILFPTPTPTPTPFALVAHVHGTLPPQPTGSSPPFHSVWLFPILFIAIYFIH